MFFYLECQIVSVDIQTGQVGVTRIQIWPLYSSVLKAVANMFRAYSPKRSHQFLWESSMESGFEEGIELYS